MNTSRANANALQVDELTEQFELIFKILEWLWRETNLIMAKSRQMEAYIQAYRVKQHVIEEKLMNLHKDGKTTLRAEGDDCYIYLPPLWKKSDIAPLLWLRCDLKKPLPEVRIYLEIYRLVATGGVKGIGFRFEAPETHDRLHASRHDYWHIQLTNDKVHEGPIWAPDHIPCFPAIAYTPVEILLYLLRCFYDKKQFNHIVSKVRVPSNHLQSLQDHGLVISELPRRGKR